MESRATYPRTESQSVPPPKNTTILPPLSQRSSSATVPLVTDLALTAAKEHLARPEVQAHLSGAEAAHHAMAQAVLLKAGQGRHGAIRSGEVASALRGCEFEDFGRWLEAYMEGLGIATPMALEDLAKAVGEYERQTGVVDREIEEYLGEAVTSRTGAEESPNPEMGVLRDEAREIVRQGREAAQAIMQAADVNRNGDLSILEVRTFLSRSPYAAFGDWLTLKKDSGRTQFSQFDKDHGGSLDMRELQEAAVEYMLQGGALGTSFSRMAAVPGDAPSATHPQPSRGSARLDVARHAADVPKQEGARALLHEKRRPSHQPLRAPMPAEAVRELKQIIRAAAYGAEGVDYYRLFPGAANVDLATFIRAMRRGKIAPERLPDAKLEALFSTLDPHDGGQIAVEDFARWMASPGSDQLVLMPLDSDGMNPANRSRNYDALDFGKGGARLDWY